MVGLHAHFLGAVLLDYHAGEKKETQKDTQFLCDLVFNACMRFEGLCHMTLRTPERSHSSQVCREGGDDKSSLFI